MQQGAFLSFQQRPGLGWLRDTWCVPRERPPEAKGVLVEGPMKESIHVVVSAFSAFPTLGWCGAPAQDTLPSSLVPSLSFPGKFPACILVFARSQKTCIQVLDLFHFHCVTFEYSLLTLQDLVSSCIKYRSKWSRYSTYQSKHIYWMHYLYIYIASWNLYNNFILLEVDILLRFYC